MFSFAVARKLFIKPGKEGYLDIAAINIHRGRDHGLPSYNEFRRACNLPVARTWADLKKLLLPGVAAKFNKVYRTPNDIDLYAGGVAEKHLPNLQVGPTFSCIIKRQFEVIRDGDRFFYDNKGVFTRRQLQELKKVKLSHILCQNLKEIISVQSDAFLTRTGQSAFRKSCASMKPLDLSPWKHLIYQEIHNHQDEKESDKDGGQAVVDDDEEANKLGESEDAEAEEEIDEDTDADDAKELKVVDVIEAKDAAKTEDRMVKGSEKDDLIDLEDATMKSENDETGQEDPKGKNILVEDEIKSKDEADTRMESQETHLNAKQDFTEDKLTRNEDPENKKNEEIIESEDTMESKEDNIEKDTLNGEQELAGDKQQAKNDEDPKTNITTNDYDNGVADQQEKREDDDEVNDVPIPGQKKKLTDEELFAKINNFADEISLD